MDIHIVCRFSAVAARAPGSLHSNTQLFWLQKKREIYIKNRLLTKWRLPKTSGREQNTSAFLVSPHSVSQIIETE